MNKISNYLKNLGINHEIRKYSSICKNAIDVSKEINFPYEQMYKTLLCQDNGKYFIAITQCGSNLKSNYSLAPINKVEEITGYKIGTVSPILLKNTIEILIDNSINNFEKISIGCGEIGKELIVSVKNSLKLTNGKLSILQEGSD